MIIIGAVDIVLNRDDAFWGSEGKKRRAAGLSALSAAPSQGGSFAAIARETKKRV
jgi:hypothetical protein